jgi:hypothetical protein
MRISYSKALEALANAAPRPLRPGHVWAQRILTPLLSDKQRAHLNREDQT